MVEASPPMPTIASDELTTYGVQTIAITIVLVSLATFAVIGRLWSRYLTALKPGLEDWLVVAALVVAWGYAAGNIACM